MKEGRKRGRDGWKNTWMNDQWFDEMRDGRMDKQQDVETDGTKMTETLTCDLKLNSSVTSYWTNLLEFSRSMSSLRGGVSWVARARQRSVSLPVPHSRILHISFSRRAGVMATFAVPTRR